MITYDRKTGLKQRGSLSTTCKLSCYQNIQNGQFDMAWVFSIWPGYFCFGMGIFRGLGSIGPSTSAAESNGTLRQYEVSLSCLIVEDVSE